MIKFKPAEEIKALLCEQMGEDYNQPACEKLKQYMEECPECKVYYDSIKKVIKLYRVTDETREIPEDVSDRLFKVLHLKKEP
ncbi:MAG: hypothetical protein GXO91_05655 [FCB group bacterium]|nr:hypothetical protein [FCB group bacterium]